MNKDSVPATWAALSTLLAVFGGQQHNLSTHPSNDEVLDACEAVLHLGDTDWSDWAVARLSALLKTAKETISASASFLDSVVKDDASSTLLYVIRTAGRRLPFLVVLAADPVMLRRDLKLIVTSATMNAEKVCLCPFFAVTCLDLCLHLLAISRLPSIWSSYSLRLPVSARLHVGGIGVLFERDPAFLSRIQNTESTAETPPAEHDPHGHVLKMTVKRDWTDESLSTMDEFSSLLNFELPCRSRQGGGLYMGYCQELLDFMEKESTAHWQQSSGSTTTSATIDGLMGGLGEKNADAIAAINKSYELEADFTNKVIEPVVVNGDDGRIKVGSLFANTTTTPMTLEGSRSKWTALWLVPSDDTHCSLQMLLDNHPLCATYETTKTNPQPLTMTECGKTNGQIFGYDNSTGVIVPIWSSQSSTVYGRDDDDSAYEERRDTQQSYPHLP
ncbi:hypothetical protein C8F01DRAFT_1309529 [Mycena amicta]|nr:hypothetical protein C8F01DRAFT_1309529 [Mycena amicta]